MIGHQEHSNAFTYLSECGQSDYIVISHMETSKYISDVALWEHCTLNCEIFRCGKVYYSNSINITNYV
jgi:hypothetical protein